MKNKYVKAFVFILIGAIFIVIAYFSYFFVLPRSFWRVIYHNKFTYGDSLVSQFTNTKVLSRDIKCYNIADCGVEIVVLADSNYSDFMALYTKNGFEDYLWNDNSTEFYSTIDFATTKPLIIEGKNIDEIFTYLAKVPKNSLVRTAKKNKTLMTYMENPGKDATLGGEKIIQNVVVIWIPVR